MTTTTVQAGTILIGDEPRLTQLFDLKIEPYSGKWSVLKGVDGFALDRQIRAAGWNFFFLATEVKVRFFGTTAAHKIQSAVKRILAKVRPQNFNALEVTSIIATHFLGIPYTTVSAHSRHIQQGRQLDHIDRRRSGQRDAEWART